MKNIKLNYNENIKYEKEINKVRAVVLNKEGRALLVHYAGLYMLPGGKIEENETQEEALKREIAEETGIEIEPSQAEKFLVINSYSENYYDREQKKEINRITNTNFYFITTNQDIDLTHTHLTESEKEGDQKVKFENLSIIPYLVQNNKSNNKKREQFDIEIQTALKEFINYREEKQNAKEK